MQPQVYCGTGLDVVRDSVHFVADSLYHVDHFPPEYQIFIAYSLLHKSKSSLANSCEIKIHKLNRSDVSYMGAMGNWKDTLVEKGPSVLSFSYSCLGARD